MAGYRELINIKKCMRCGYYENKGSLHVHHLDRNRYNNTHKNLIVLCANCHSALHQGKWKLEDIGLKTRHRQRNISQKKSIKGEIKEIKQELDLMKESIKNASNVLLMQSVNDEYKYISITNPKYIVNSCELSMYINNTRILSVSEYDNITHDIKNPYIQAIFDIMIITGVNYLELLQLYQYPELYQENSNKIVVIRLGDEHEINVFSAFKYVLKCFRRLPFVLCEDTLNRILQIFASRNGITPYGITLSSLRKSREVWMYKSGIKELEIYTENEIDLNLYLNKYQGLCFSDEEVRDIKTRVTAWGFKVD